MKIDYLFRLGDGSEHRFAVDLDRTADPSADGASHAFWTKLDFHKCHNCPLDQKQCGHCPAALDLEGIVPIFQKILSYEKVEVEVTTPDRTYSKKCDVQTGLRSLLGLVMATSQCPVLGRLKSLAHYHLPFGTMEETIFRTAGAYMLAQYFRQQEGLKPDYDLKGLDALYEQLQVVNQCFKKRIDATAEKDAAMNAVATLCAISMGVCISLHEHLEELKETVSPLAKPSPST